MELLNINKFIFINMDYEYDNPEENGTENYLDQSAYGLLEDLSTSRYTRPEPK